MKCWHKELLMAAIIFYIHEVRRRCKRLLLASLRPFSTAAAGAVAVALKIRRQLSNDTLVPHGIDTVLEL